MPSHSDPKLYLKHNKNAQRLLFLVLMISAHMDDFKAMNAVYAEAFGDHRPARSTVAVDALPVGALVEIEVIAEVG